MALTVGPIFLLILLDLLVAQTRTLVGLEVEDDLLGRLGMRVIHGYLCRSGSPRTIPQGQGRSLTLRARTQAIPRRARHLATRRVRGAKGRKSFQPDFAKAAESVATNGPIASPGRRTSPPPVGLSALISFTPFPLAASLTAKRLPICSY